MFLFDLCLIICVLSALLLFLARTEVEYQRFLKGRRFFPSHLLSWADAFVGSRTILIDTGCNYSGGRQHTVVVRGQHKTINHNSIFLPSWVWPIHAQPKSNSANMCLHICLHQPLACSGPSWLNFPFPWLTIFQVFESKSSLLKPVIESSWGEWDKIYSIYTVKTRYLDTLYKWVCTTVFYILLFSVRNTKMTYDR